jgi:hypothetical protein
MKKPAIIFIMFFFFLGFAFTQEQYGNIRGVVMDGQGNLLPGVTVTLDSKLYNSRSVTTTQGGIFRFINVYPGTYTLHCELAGFKSHIQENLIIRVGNNFDLQIVMEPAVLEEEVTVIAQSPIVDTKKTGTASNITLDMLQEIPSARDPWVILQHVAGIDISTENVGGSHTGQQSEFTSKGASPSSAMWNLDGIPITDMVATGYSSRYFDFDSFSEMQVVTSGANADIQTSGVSINIITHRGSNKLGVMGRMFFANDDLQGDNRTQELKDMDYVGNRINQILDYGLQVGGPLKKDKLWFWIGHGIQDIRRLTIDGYPDEIKIAAYNAKLNFRIFRKNRAELNINYYDKRRDGFGVGPFSPPETSWDQTADSTFIKLEDTHTFSDNFLLTLKLATSFGTGEFVPKGGMNVQAGYDYFTGMSSGSCRYEKDERPSHSAKIDGNYFVENLLGGGHEFQFGVEYRLTPARNYTTFPQNVYKYYWDGVPLFAEVSRERNQDSRGDRYSFYINDSYSRGRLTLNLGFRFDREKSVVNEATVKASQIAPELLPQLTFPGIDPGVSFKTFSPRIGFTFALTKDRKTVLRGNLARYSQPMASTLANHVNPAAMGYAAYSWVDINGDDLVSTDELIGYPLAGILWYGGFDPWNPTSLDDPDVIDRDYKSTLTDELLFGIEREIFPDFSLSATLILRRTHRTGWQILHDKETGWTVGPENYIDPTQGTLTYEGETYQYEYWTLDRYRPAGRLLTNRPGYHTNYTGIEISAAKRLSHRWMMNASFSLQRNILHYGENGYNDPTNKDKWEGRPAFGDAQWMAKLSFLYKLPWEFNISLFAHAKQGYAQSQQILVMTPERAAVGLGGVMYMDIEKYGETRLPTFYNMDVSLVKNIRIGKYGTFSLHVDAFNVFNFDHALWRYGLVNSPSYNEIWEILNPRVVRLGIRYRF